MAERIGQGWSALAVILFFSGAGALIDELVLSRLLAHFMGSSAQAGAAVLVAFMGGMALGSAICAKRLARVRRPLRACALIEAAIGASALVLPPLVGWLDHAYTPVLHATLPMASVAALRFLGAVLVVSIPGALMGATLPLALEAATRVLEGRDTFVERLYASNTLGAAAGVLSFTYVFVPWFGLTGTLRAAASLNIVAALGALLFELRLGRPVRDASQPLDPAGATPPWLPPRRGLTIALLSGLCAFALETLYFRMLAVVVGNSVYAFGLMLFVFLVGNGLGSRLAHRLRDRGPVGLPIAQAAVGITTAATLWAWPDLPSLFRLVGAYAPSFVVWELAWALCVGLLIGPATLAMGLAFGLLLRATGGQDLATSARIARLYAVNTVGAILGTLLATFVLAPAIGSQASFALVALCEVAIGLLAMTPELGTRVVRLGLSGGLVASLAVAVLATDPWDVSKLLAGSNVHFGEGIRQMDQVRFLKEDSAGGIVAVVESRGTRTLVANGQFEGNDSFEMSHQQLCALLPMLVARDHKAALNIGIGTANTLAAIAAFPFEHVDAVDISSAIVDAARTEFEHLNKSVLDDARVAIHIDDGRAFLRVTDRRYDVIELQGSAMWISGSADLYNVEFYEAARARLARGGVLSQWLQLRHIEAVDVARVLASVRAVFPEVTLWIVGHQAIIVAGEAPLKADMAALKRWPHVPRIKELLKTTGLDHPYAAFGDLYLDSDGIDRFVRDVEIQTHTPHADLVSVDDRPLLEYSTPRGNLLEDALARNTELLMRYATASPLDHLVGDVREEDERLLLAYAARWRGYRHLAKWLVEPVAQRFVGGIHDPLLRDLSAVAEGDPWP